MAYNCEPSADVSAGKRFCDLDLIRSWSDCLVCGRFGIGSNPLSDSGAVEFARFLWWLLADLERLTLLMTSVSCGPASDCI